MQSLQQTNHEPLLLHQRIYATAKIAAIAAVLSLAGSLAGIISVISKPSSSQAIVPTQEGFSEAEMQQLTQFSVYASAFISLAIGVLAFYFLFRFATLAKSGISQNVPSKLTGALQNLGRYFKIWGVIMFLIIALFILSLLGGMLGSFFGK